MRFNGSSTYVSTDDLTLAVNAAITLGRPLLIKGDGLCVGRRGNKDQREKWDAVVHAAF